MHSKISFHAGTPCGGCTGIDRYWKAVNEAKIPFGMYAVNGGGIISNASQYPYGKHLIYRDYRYDNVPYNIVPENGGALSLYNQIINDLPPEIKAIKDKVWIEVFNEPDQERSEMVARWQYELAVLFIKGGYKFCGPGWSTGTPRVEAWNGLHMRKYLELCAQYPGMVALTLHEYSLEVNDILAQSPWLAGRFRFVNEYCDKVGINRPTIFITEMGWTYNDLPPRDRFINDLDTIGKIYNDVANVKAVFLWSLITGREWANIGLRLNAFMDDVITYNLKIGYTEDKPVEPPKPPIPPIEPGERHKAIVVKLPQDATKSDWTKAAEYAYDFRHTMTASHDDMVTVLRGGAADSLVKIAWPQRQPDTARLVEQLGYQWTPIFDSVLDGLKLGHILGYAYMVTDRFDTPRTYGNQKHEGVDFDVLGGRPDNTVPVLAVYDGVVDKVGTTTGGYGKYIRVAHSRSGKLFYTWYGHLDAHYVKEGEQVKAGSPLGEIGSTGNSNGEHVHLTLQVPGEGKKGYVVDDVLDPLPFMPPESSMYAFPSVNSAIDMLPYLRGDGRIYTVGHILGATEQFQSQTDSANPRVFYQVKNNQWEQFYFDEAFIWRGIDTSPGPYKNTERYYRQYEDNNSFARWIPRRMYHGQSWAAPVQHNVQFHNKKNCAPLSDFSGKATNAIKFAGHYAAKTFTIGGKSYTVQNVIQLETAHERYYYARGYGLVAWNEIAKPENSSSIVSEYKIGGHPDLAREVIPCLKV